MSGSTNDFSVSSFAGLSADIGTIDSETTPATYTLDITGDIALSGALPEISLASGVALDIIGNGSTLDGGGAEPGLFVYQGTVSIDDLTLLDTTITGGEAPHGANRGGTGYGGYGGGSAGLGGGLFVGSKAAVTLDGVNFTNDGAIGGNGGPGGQGATGTGPAGFGQGGSGGNQGSPFNVGGNGLSGGFGGGGGGGGGGGSGYFFYDDGKGGGTIAGNGGAGGKGGFGAGNGAAGKTGATVRVSAADHLGTSTNSTGTHVYTYTSRVMSGTPNPSSNGGGAGGGGLGAGGDIFVQGGGKLKLLGGSLGAGTVKGGSGANPGSAFGSGIFLQGREEAVLAPNAGETLTILGVIADEDGSEPGYGADQGSIAIDGPGTVLLNAANTFEGGIILSGGTLLLGAAGAAGGGGITFTNDPRMAFTAADAPANTISGFAPGDGIDITDLKKSSVSQNYSPNGNGGVLTLTGTQLGSGNPETVHLNFSGTSGNFYLEPDAGGGTQIAICYLRGTRLLTPEGNVAIEELAPGDRLVTRFGGTRRIKWIGRQSFAWRFLPPDRHPVRILAHAFELGMPSRDLLVSPGHSMLIDNQLVLAETLINGITIRREPAPAAEDASLDYVQVEFATHDCVLANGAWSETYADAPGLRAQFHNAAEYTARYPDDPPPNTLALCAPRPEHGARLESALRPIAARAAASISPGRLEGYVDMAGGWHVHGWALDTDHPELPVLLEVVLADELLGTALAYQTRDDLRAAGKGVGRCAFVFTTPSRLPADAASRLTVRRAADGAQLAFAAPLRAVA